MYTRKIKKNKADFFTKNVQFNLQVDNNTLYL